MKPILLEMQAFGPFVEKQTVDFEKLGKNGIFLIKGKTGSGKTTLFDAMTFALYGGASGDNDKTKTGRNDLEEWRCIQADANTDTMVAFTFSVRGERYRFMRSLIQKRVNLSAKYEAGKIDDEGNVIPFFSNPKKDDLTRKAEELIGLNKEQFRQVVLLPQGQFERFLTASSGEKESILQKIFGTERWCEYAEAFFELAAGKKNELKQLAGEIAASLNEEGLENPEQLDERIGLFQRQKEALEKRHAEFDSAGKQQALGEDIRLAEQFRPLHDTEERLKALEAKKEEMALNRQYKAEAEKAEKFREPLRDYETAKKEKEDREDSLNRLRQALPEIQKKKENAEKEKEGHEKNSPVERLNREIGLLEGKKPVYNTIDLLKNALTDAGNRQKLFEKESETAQKALNAASAAVLAKKKEYDQATDTAKLYRDQYYAGICGEIAGGLREGAECPVCGSLSHPRPARKCPGSVSKDELNQKEEALEEAKKRWSAAEEERAKAEEISRKKNAALEADRVAFAKAKAEYEKASENLIDGIGGAKELQAAIIRRETEKKRCGEQGKKLAQAFELASKQLAAHGQQIKSAEEEFISAQEKYGHARRVLLELLAAEGLEDDSAVKKKLLPQATRDKLQKDIAEYDVSVSNAKTELEKRREELKGKAEPDSRLFAQRQNEIKNELSQYNANAAKLSESIHRLVRKQTALRKKQAEYDANIDEAERVSAFAKKLRGDSDTGIHRYVLAIMFNQVIAEANRLLTKIHGGRYQLCRTDDKMTGNKRGLELKAYDKRKPEMKDGRSVDSLSGGEKFLVSLALSIGLSWVAQKSGIQIEALFIDEGFGTLDESSIADAMDVLDSVRKGAGMIGIISHVQLLEANIPTHLEVVKKDTGSLIRMV